MCMYTHLIVVLEGLQPVAILVIHLSYPLQYSGVRGNKRHQLKEPGACVQGGREEMYSTCEGWLSPGGHSSGGRALTAKVRDPRFNPGWLLVFHGSLIIFPSLSSCTRIRNYMYLYTLQCNAKCSLPCSKRSPHSKQISKSGLVYCIYTM